MSRLKLLILDANVVIHLHEFGIWGKLIAACDVHLPGTVVNEADFYDLDGQRQYIDLSDDIGDGRVKVFNIALDEIKAFRDRFEPLYVDGLDDGETEALAYLCASSENFMISSGDAIVYRVLDRLNRSDRGISLEEILKQVGLQRNRLPWSCTRKFRDQYTKEGEIHSVQGIGLKSPKK
jgi:hypothetical protein